MTHHFARAVVAHAVDAIEVDPAKPVLVRNAVEHAEEERERVGQRAIEVENREFVSHRPYFTLPTTVVGCAHVPTRNALGRGSRVALGQNFGFVTKCADLPRCNVYIGFRLFLTECH
jgi:hypothetical protein